MKKIINLKQKLFDTNKKIKSFLDAFYDYLKFSTAKFCIKLVINIKKKVKNKNFLIFQLFAIISPMLLVYLFRFLYYKKVEKESRTIEEKFTTAKETKVEKILGYETGN